MSPIIYQVYLKSFQDSNNDGIGDLNGLLSRIDYLSSLGITAIWLNPIFESPDVDNGYDVSDYYHIDQKFGTLQDFQHVVAACHAQGISLYLDLVINHTSDQHAWFKSAIASKESPYRDYYIWQDATPDTPPTNWASFFGGSTWAYDETSQQSYFHLFAKEMPDLNWDNQAMVDELAEIAAYWLAQGVDGFRLDAVSHLAKDRRFLSIASQTNEPLIAEQYYANLTKNFKHLQDFKQTIAAKTSLPFVLLGEAASAQPEDTTAYLETLDALITFGHFKTVPAPYNLPMVDNKQPLDLVAFKDTLAAYQAQSKNTTGGLGLYLSNHDHPRAVSRFGDGSAPSAKALVALQFFLHGWPIIYQGEELGLPNASHDQLSDYTDPSVANFTAAAQQLLTLDEQLDIVQKTSKEAARGTMHWDDSHFHGFSTVTPWNNLLTTGQSYAQQIEQQNSTFHFYRQLIALRKEWSHLIAKGSTHFYDPLHPYLFFISRHLDMQTLAVRVNLSSETITLSQPPTIEEKHLIAEAYNPNSQQLGPYGILITLKEEH